MGLQRDGRGSVLSLTDPQTELLPGHGAAISGVKANFNHCAIGVGDLFARRNFAEGLIGGDLLVHPFNRD